MSAEDALFDEESGEAMVGFDVHDRDRRRDGIDQQVSAGLGILHSREDEAASSDRRLSRELEQGFRDDSDDEAEANAVTAGRRSFAGPA